MQHIVARLGLFGALILAAAGGSGSVGAQPAPSMARDLFAGLSWRCIGPFDGGPVASVTGTPGEPGIYVVTTPSGGAWKTVDGGDTWVAMADHPAASTSDPHRWTDAANPRRIVRTDPLGIEVSLDGGQTWTASHRLPIAEVARIAPRALPAEPAGRRHIAGQPATVSIADRIRPGLVFAGTRDSVYVSFDAGARWQPLRLNMPGVAITDVDIRGNDLVAATEGRSVWQIDDISPLRQVTAASAQATAILFKPADATLTSSGTQPEGRLEGTALDYYIGRAASGDVTLEIADASGRIVHAATSAKPDPTDRWLPVMRPLSAAPGHHRTSWNLRLDPPPAHKHRFAQLARAAFEEMPPDPDGPRALAGTYRVTLTVARRTYSQTLVVRDDPRATPAARAAARRAYDLAMPMYDAMQIAHRSFVQIQRVRAGLRPLVASADPQVAATAADLDARLVQLDGSDWTGLVIPDADDEAAGEVDEKEGKHPDFVPPKPVSVSKDYDDPTSILGRRFANVNHAPALTPLSADLGAIMTRAVATPDLAGADYDRACQELSGVLDVWRSINGQDLASVNTLLASRKLPALPFAASVPAIVCR